MTHNKQISSKKKKVTGNKERNEQQLYKENTSKYEPTQKNRELRISSILNMKSL